MLNLGQIIERWSYWDSEPPKSIQRKALQQLHGLHTDLVLAIQGVRRCGKSTLLSQIMQTQKLNPKHCFFINFEDPRLSKDLNTQTLDAMVAFTHHRVTQAKKCYFFLDEIQHLDGWEKWLHSQVERPSRNIFIITGSNASLLSGDLSSSLTGRYTKLELFPFDFEEHKQFFKQADFESFLASGGFPRSLNYPEPEKLRQEYFSQIIERDVQGHVNARSKLALIQLVIIVFESMGSELSQRKLGSYLGLSADTIGTYLDACQAAYMILPCPYFTWSEKQRTVRNKKYYPIDLGLRSASINTTGQDLGKKLECVVFHHLRKKYGKVFYWKDHHEMDFVVMDKNTIKSFQVSWGEEKQRHVLAGEAFTKKFPQAPPYQFINRKTIETFLQT